MRIWFHGTSEVAARSIAAEGFRPNTWFSAHLEDAIEFGGPFVFWTLLDYAPGTPGNWQMCVRPAVPASAIRKFVEYHPLIIEDYPERGPLVAD
jgi:hypothetical protein